jgi:hypothetical protein
MPSVTAGFLVTKKTPDRRRGVPHTGTQITPITIAQKVTYTYQYGNPVTALEHHNHVFDIEGKAPCIPS